TMGSIATATEPEPEQSAEVQQDDEETAQTQPPGMFTLPLHIREEKLTMRAETEAPGDTPGQDLGAGQGQPYDSVETHQPEALVEEMPTQGQATKQATDTVAISQDPIAN